jgi:hypothetical protein
MLNPKINIVSRIEYHFDLAEIVDIHRGATSRVAGSGKGIRRIARDLHAGRCRHGAADEG